MRVSLVVAVLAATAACTLSPERVDRVATDSSSALQVGIMQQRAAAAPSAVPEAREWMAALAAPSVSMPTLGIPSSMVIRTGQTSIEVDSLERAVAQVRLLAGRVGGYVANTTMQTGRGQLRAATLEVKIPAARFDDGLDGLSVLGKLESVNVNAEDVGEEYTDVTARMTNARRLETRLIELLATRTGKLKDVLDVEQELARVREEIERYEGRIRYLRAHTATSTLSVYVHEPVPIVASVGRSPLSEAFRQAWRNFVVLLSLAVQSLGVVLPLGFVAAVAWAMTRRWRVAKQKAA